jgi:hypothetical protein
VLQEEKQEKEEDEEEEFVLLSYVHNCTDHIPWDGPGVGVGCLTRCGGLLALVGTSVLLLVGTTDCSPTVHRIHQAFLVACSEQVHCVNAFGVGNSCSSLTTKSCACASVSFLSGIISWSVESRRSGEIDPALRKGQGERTLQ